MAAAVGGTAASISGGKFANGAITGAYVVLFNHMRHQGRSDKSPSKEWLQNKANEVIEAEKLKNIDNEGYGSNDTDLNFEGYENDDEYFGLASDVVREKIIIKVENEEYHARIVYTPSTGNPVSNIVTNIHPEGISGYYGAEYKGMYQLLLQSHQWGNSKYTPAIIYVDKKGYESYLRYTND